MEKKNMIVVVVISVLIMSPLIIMLGMFIVPQAMDPGDGGGGVVPPYIPPEEEPPDPDDPVQLDSPQLYDITPFIDDDGDILLEWSFIRDATCYKIFRGKEGKNYQLIKVNGLYLYYYDRDLSDGFYAYYIIASNEDIDSKASNIRSIQVNIPPPSPPQLYSIYPTESETGIIKLKWSGLSNYEYNVYRAKNSDTYSLITSSLTSKEFIDSGLEDGQYKYYITAIENGKESVPSNIKVVRVTLPIDQPPTEPDQPPTVNLTFPIIVISLITTIGLISVWLIIKIRKFK